MCGHGMDSSPATASTSLHMPRSCAAVLNGATSPLLPSVPYQSYIHHKDFEAFATPGISTLHPALTSSSMSSTLINVGSNPTVAILAQSDERDVGFARASKNPSSPFLATARGSARAYPGALSSMMMILPRVPPRQGRSTARVAHIYLLPNSCPLGDCADYHSARKHWTPNCTGL